jgi:hypothetical protein
MKYTNVVEDNKLIKKSKVLKIFLYIFAIEKAIQHLLSSIFFIIDIPRIGIPDIGNNFKIDNYTMSLLNIIYFSLFVLGILGLLKNNNYSLKLIIFLALIDIILEFTFHHFFFITVSVIFSVLLSIVTIKYLNTIKKIKLLNP